MNKFIFSHIVKQNKPKKHFLKECVLAFLFGGLLGVLAQGLKDIFLLLEIEEEVSSTLSSFTIIFIYSLL